MAAKASDQLPVGTRIVVADGVDSPDFPEISFAGWTGTVVEHSGRKSARRYIIEWSGETLQAMPDDYQARCERQGLLYSMACLERHQFVVRAD